MKASDNPYPSVLLAEGAAPAAPAVGLHRLFVDTADGVLKRIDNGGTITPVDAADVDTVLTVLRDKLTAVGGETHLNLGEPPVSGSLMVWKNGTQLWPTDDWTIAGSVATFVVALTAADVIRTYYITGAGASAASTLS